MIKDIFNVRHNLGNIDKLLHLDLDICEVLVGQGQ